MVVTLTWIARPVIDMTEFLTANLDSAMLTQKNMKNRIAFGRTDFNYE
jgi:hypothetical protein